MFLVKSDLAFHFVDVTEIEVDFVIIRIELQSLTKILFCLIVSFQINECMTKEHEGLRHFLESHKLAVMPFSHGPATQLAVALRDHKMCLMCFRPAFCDLKSKTDSLFPFTFMTK